MENLFRVSLWFVWGLAIFSLVINWLEIPFAFRADGQQFPIFVVAIVGTFAYKIWIRRKRNLESQTGWGNPNRTELSKRIDER